MTDSTIVILPGGQLAYSLKQLPSVAPFSEATFRRAIRKEKDDGVFPHPLQAQRDSTGKAIVLATVLQAWLEALPDY